MANSPSAPPELRFPLQSGPPRPYIPWTREEKERLRQAVADMIVQEQAALSTPPSETGASAQTTDKAQAGT